MARKLVDLIPLIDNFKINNLARIRVMLLNCITNHYSKLWTVCWNDIYRQDAWGKKNLRLMNSKFQNLKPKWQKNFPLLIYYERRQALVEIDVLAAMGFGMSLDDLCTVYMIYDAIFCIAPE